MKNHHFPAVMPNARGPFRNLMCEGSLSQPTCDMTSKQKQKKNLALAISVSAPNSSVPYSQVWFSVFKPDLDLYFTGWTWL